MLGLFASISLAIVAIIGHIITKPYSYPWLPMNTTQCPNSTFEFTANWTEKAFLNSQPPTTNWIFSLGFPYFALFAVVCCLSTATIVSLISLIVRKIVKLKPNVEVWLSPPKNVDKNLFRLPKKFL